MKGAMMPWTPALLALLIIFSAAGAEAFWPFPDKKQETVLIAEPSGAGLTLRRAFELALANAEVIAIEQEKLKEVESHFYTALDEVTPDLNFLLTEAWQDTPSKGEQTASGSDGFSSNVLRRAKPEAKFTFSQPLFSGFKEIAAINASGADKKRQTALLRKAKLMLFLEVSRAYYNLQEARQNLLLLNQMQSTLEKRVKRLEERVELGRSRKSEAEISRADLRLIEADAAEEKRLESVSRQLLEFYTGLDRIEDLDEDFPPLELKNDPSIYTAKAADRADVIAARESFNLAKEDVTAARSNFLPKGSVDGNYYTRRVGFQEGTDWDLLWKLEVPIFNGTGDIGALKEAESRRVQAELESKRLERYARTEIINGYDTLIAWISQEKALRAARDAAANNYRIQDEEYGLSLVSNLDVLDAFRRSQEVALRWSRASHEVKRKYWEFRAAQGETVL
jgi:outer membrane protein TolC